MRVVTLEEHFTVPSLVRRISPEAIARRGFVRRTVPPGRVNPVDLLPEIGETRLKSMNEAGITVQVLSTSGPGASGSGCRVRRVSEEGAVLSAPGEAAAASGDPEAGGAPSYRLSHRTDNATNKRPSSRPPAGRGQSSSSSFSTAPWRITLPSSPITVSCSLPFTAMWAA